MQVEVISTPELGDRSYVVHDGRLAVVIDPQRDVDRVDAVLDRLHLRVELILETHIHNDYVTGGYELARRTGARYALNAADPVSFERTSLRDGDELIAGALCVRAVATPGHTATHLAYVISDTAAPDIPPAVFTGGSLLFGSVGRTDLVDPARTRELTRAQYRSAHHLADTLPDAAAVYPTHGFGSFCSSGSATGGPAGDASTIGHERARNDALVAADEDRFVDELVAGLTAYPAYYVHMAPLNRSGPLAPDQSAVEKVDAVQLRARLAAGEWVVDLRDRVAYAADHLRGSVSIALGAQFATYVGWLVPWGAPLTLVAESAEQVSDARRQLVRIGIDELAGAASGDFADVARGHDRGTYRRVGFPEVERGAGNVVLDVRRDDERACGYIVASAHVPLADLLTRLPDLPPGRVWVHCASGFRAGIAASLLARAGRDVVHIDDDYANATTAGLETT